MADVLIDIETLPADAFAGMDLKAHAATLPLPEAPSRYSKPESIRAWQEDPKNQIEHYRRSVFRWADVRVGCIGIADENAAHVFDCAEPATEQSTIWEFVEKLPKTGRIFTWGDYDARILRSRMLYHGIPFGPFGIDAKPWERRIVDLQAMFAEIVNGSPRSIKGISVDAACEFLGIDRLDNPIPGSEVLDCYIGGRWDQVLAHCRSDVADEWLVWQTMRGVL